MTHRHECFDRIAALTRAGRRFALATVVGRRPPVSAHLGDRAIVFADGRMEGFVGGACAREIIRRQALEALTTRRARLVCIRPEPSEANAPDVDRIVVAMTCASEGAVDVYVEPIGRSRTVVVAGATPVADAVTRLARAMRYEVVRAVDPAEHADVEPGAALLGASVVSVESLPSALQAASAEGGECAIVVASQGHYDEPALSAGLACGAIYVGLVASRKRGDTLRQELAAAGVPRLERLRYPAGLDLGGERPEEVAVAILAEIVRTGAQAVAPSTTTRETAPDTAETPATRRPTAGQMPIVSAGASPPPASGAATAIDPVCHMEVVIAGATHLAEVGGATHYFCCGGCRSRFLKEPWRYLAPIP